MDGRVSSGIHREQRIERHAHALKQTSIFSLDLNSRVVKKISPKNGVYKKPVVSPDNQNIAFLGTESRDYSSVAFDLWIYSNTSARRLTDDLSSTPDEVIWTSNQSLVINVDERGSRRLKSINTKSAKIRDVDPSFKDQFFLSSVQGKKLVGTIATPNRPAEVAIFSKGEYLKLTDFNELLLTQYQLGKPKKLITTRSTGSTYRDGISSLRTSLNKKIPPHFDYSRWSPCDVSTSI